MKYIERIPAHTGTKKVVEKEESMLKSRRRDKTHNFAQIFAPGTQLSLVQHFKGVNISFFAIREKKANDETSEIGFN